MSPTFERTAKYQGLGWGFFLIFIAAIVFMDLAFGPGPTPTTGKIFWMGYGLLANYLHWRGWI